MKFIAALLSRFSNRPADEQDFFDLRLRSMTTPSGKRPPQQQESAPHLFRRDLGHA